MAREARSGGEGGVTARRRRRNRDEPSTDTHSDHVASTSIQANSLVSFSNIPPPVIDPQLTGMSHFQTEASVGSNSFQPLPLSIPNDAVALVTPSDNEALYRMTSTQVPT